jgi:hypothetical protein
MLMVKRLVPYGIMNYAELVEKQAYFIDKTEYISKLEDISNPVYLRPRRFGKSLFCSMLQYYYDLKESDRFFELFGHTWIGQHPTGKQNAYLVLKLDLSTIETNDNLPGIERNFRRTCNAALIEMKNSYPGLMQNMPVINPDESTSTNLSIWLQHLKSTNAPQVYVIIDEYDNFANHLITTHHDHLYRKLTADDSFLKSFFKVLKAGRQTGAIANIFITGILPVTIDDLSSAYNIADFITLHPELEGLLGFTETEINHLLDQVYRDYEFDPKTRQVVDEVIKSQYNGYHFVSTKDGAALYNSTMVMYFIREFCRFNTIPNNLIDLNLRTDLSWVQRITGAHPNSTEEIVSQLASENTIRYDQDALITQFNMSDFFKPQFYPILFFYLGLLTRKDDFYLCLPNLSIKKIFIEYFNDLYQIDVGTRYTEFMERFVVSNPDIAELFSGYWREYVSQLPEAVFVKVNENFYRTTFYELCSRFLSKWLTFNIERSYPAGRSDLEFVGKFNEKFAGRRWIIEFKYYSNAEFAKFGCAPDEFSLQHEDVKQIVGYAHGLAREYPEVNLSLHVIYCFGNRGFRVFEVKDN